MVTDHDLNSSFCGIQLKGGQSASEIFHQVLQQGVEAFPEPFSGLNFPAYPNQFRKRYVHLVPDFEAARLISPARNEIAERLANEIHTAFLFDDGKEPEPLATYLQRDFSPLPLVDMEANSIRFWKPHFTYRHEDWSALDILAEELLNRDVISLGAAQALLWLQENLVKAGTINLSDRKIVVLGANAEMASSRQFLEAGADVLWLDKVPPLRGLIDSPTRAGRLTWTEHADLLNQPGEILATISAFAANEPVDLCLYAYAPGQARELKLTTAMNAIANALPEELIRSITLLLSPTTATPIQETDINAMQSRRDHRPAWEALLAGSGLLGAVGGSSGDTDIAATRSLVGIQGTSYQAAQYLGKQITAECWATTGQIGKPVSRPIRVSANTAAITKTRSMDHPVFDAAFDGAAAFQIETFTPDQSRCLNGLLTVHDWIHPQPPSPASIRVHGGIHTLPYPLDSALRIAAAIGFVRSPGLLRGLLR